MAYSVKELMEMLSALPQDMPVVVVAKNGSVKEITGVAFNPMAGGAAIGIR